MNTAIDSILDMNLEDLADMPAFFVPPNGAYSATILSMASKKIGEHPAVEVNLRIDAVLELADTAASGFNSSFNAPTPYSLSVI